MLMLLSMDLLLCRAWSRGGDVESFKVGKGGGVFCWQIIVDVICGDFMDHGCFILHVVSFC